MNVGLKHFSYPEIPKLSTQSLLIKKILIRFRQSMKKSRTEISVNDSCYPITLQYFFSWRSSKRSFHLFLLVQWEQKKIHSWFCIFTENERLNYFSYFRDQTVCCFYKLNNFSSECRENRWIVVWLKENGKLLKVLTWGCASNTESWTKYKILAH